MLILEALTFADYFAHNSLHRTPNVLLHFSWKLDTQGLHLTIRM